MAVLVVAFLIATAGTPVARPSARLQAGIRNWMRKVKYVLLIATDPLGELERRLFGTRC